MPRILRGKFRFPPIGGLGFRVDDSFGKDGATMVERVAESDEQIARFGPIAAGLEHAIASREFYFENGTE
jgi:hypothetical protein